MGFCAFFKLVLGFEFFPLPNRIHAHPPASNANRYVVGIITDNKKDRIDHLKQYQHLESWFRPIVVSAEVGVDKESTEIFMHALNCAGVKAEESVFIDNNKANLVAASALGIKTIFHDDEKNDINALCQTLNR